MMPRKWKLLQARNDFDAQKNKVPCTVPIL